MTHNPVEKLREALVKRVKKEGLRPFSERTGVPLGQIRSVLESRRVNIETVERIAEVIGFEFYVGPPKSENNLRAIRDPSVMLAELIEIFFDIKDIEDKAIFLEACRVFVRDDDGAAVNQRA